MGSRTLFLILLGVVALTRIVELAISKRRVSGLKVDAAKDAAPPDPNYRFMVVVHSILFVLPPIEVLWLDRVFRWDIAGPALAALVIATGLRVWVIRILGASWNTKGIVDPSMTVVTRGPYRWIRHPNYLAVILEIAALPLVHTAWISALVLSALNGLVLAGRIPQEEKALFAIPEYEAAFKDKPRILPFL